MQATKHTVSLYGVEFSAMHNPVHVLRRKYGPSWCIEQKGCHALFNTDADFKSHTIVEPATFSTDDADCRCREKKKNVDHTVGNVWAHKLDDRGYLL